MGTTLPNHSQSASGGHTHNFGLETLDQQRVRLFVEKQRWSALNFQHMNYIDELIRNRSMFVFRRVAAEMEEEAVAVEALITHRIGTQWVVGRRWDRRIRT